MALLEIENLTVEFATAAGAFRAVEGVSLAVEPRDVLAIVGESGSGKSVSMLAVMGLLPPAATVTADRMRFDGLDLMTLTAKQKRRLLGNRISMIFQEPTSSLNPCFTIGFQLAEVLKIHTELGRSARRARAIELLDQVGIPAPQTRLGAFPHQLSGGMNQRVMIAIAIACNPKLLIADEPTTALDVTIQAQIIDLLLRLRRETGMAMILVTHDMGVVAETAQRVSVHYAGQKMEEQPVLDLFADPHHPYTSALLSALPERAEPGDLPSIPGVVPGLFDRPKACLFSPRCRYATDRCVTVKPVRASRAEGEALCHYPLVEGVPQGHPAFEAAL